MMNQKLFALRNSERKPRPHIKQPCISGKFHWKLPTFQHLFNLNETEKTTQTKTQNLTKIDF